MAGTMRQVGPGNVVTLANLPGGLPAILIWGMQATVKQLTVCHPWVCVLTLMMVWKHNKNRLIIN